MLARGEPACLAALERFARNADQFELIVAKGVLQRPIETMYLSRRWSRPWGIGGNDEAAPDFFSASHWFASACGRGNRNQQSDPSESGEKNAAHRYFAA